MKHAVRLDVFGGRHYAHCRPLSCGWVGRFRRWQWQARRDGVRHLERVEHLQCLS